MDDALEVVRYEELDDEEEDEEDDHEDYSCLPNQPSLERCLARCNKIKRPRRRTLLVTSFIVFMVFFLLSCAALLSLVISISIAIYECFGGPCVMTKQ